MGLLSTIEIPPSQTHRYSIIWLHGLGADGHDFEGIVSELKLDNVQYIRFIFPNAPHRPVTLNGGMTMRAWYDLIGLTESAPVDFDGIAQSCHALAQLIDREIDQGIVPEHILLAGFSQGGMIALHCGLCYPNRLAGVLGLSTYLPTLKQVAQESPNTNQDLPILMTHGILDSVIEIEVAKKAYDGLKALGFQIEWRDYLMEHSLCVEELDHISEFINKVFKAV